MEYGICRFIPFHKDTHSLHTINFVLETAPQQYAGLKSETVYKMHYVCGGTGVLHTAGRRTELKEGDLFFTFPAAPFAIESRENFSYMYISFVGIRGNMLMEKLQISPNNFLFSGMHEVRMFWNQGLTAKPTAMDVLTEAILLYTFACLDGVLLPEEEQPKLQQSVNQIKKYVDDHFAEQSFSIEQISRQLSYNKKYISHIFKKHIGVGIVEYLNTVRIQNACTMIEQGFTSVTDIADRCGYSDGQYFSKIFKSKLGVSPTEYMKNLQLDKKKQ